MTSTAIIVLALAVLAVAILMILRELNRAKSHTAQISTSKAPAVSVEPPRANPHAEDDDVDVTKVGNLAPRPPAALPKLDVDANNEDAVSESTAMTLYEEGAEVDEPTGPSDLILVSAAAQSDIGKKRRRNEDSYLLDDSRALFVVADGMGGYAGGDVASKLATETIAKFLQNHDSNADRLPSRPKMPKMGNELVASIEAANSVIHAEALKNPDYHGMGTTIVAASFTKKKKRAYIAYAGDSRCYRLRDGRLKLLTVDHTYANKGITGPAANHIRRAVGVRPTIKVDLIVDSPSSGDAYVLCSDGLNKMLKDDELQAVVESNHGDLSSCAQALVDRANAAGGKDNVTVVVVSVQEPKVESDRGQAGALGA